MVNSFAVWLQGLSVLCNTSIGVNHFGSIFVDLFLSLAAFGQGRRILVGGEANEAEALGQFDDVKFGEAMTVGTDDLDFGRAHSGLVVGRNRRDSLARHGGFVVGLERYCKIVSDDDSTVGVVNHTFGRRHVEDN